MSAQTSDRVSSIAARYVNISPNQLMNMTDSGKGLVEVTNDIKSMAASCLAQDEVKGFRKLLKIVTG